ncbi:hypothetical protein M408DRAFT_26896 [Serendipita vermifera MAFF 305830]|uniref:Uncharacterized protein n=1 Tax=Serendipita vermifera MAFF 305830 TaxID=933852 RepID=A0A0C2X5Q3_SERVB|nr:hypothetical protein M408DRAFT_26896 [Serendipita vermifera MAFF 305830]
MSERGTYDELPPHYTDDVSNVPPTFQIGIHVSPPLVTLTEVQAHLRLLSAFAVLKSHVERGMEDPQCAWEVFLHKAVYRFDRFMSGKWTGPFPSWCEEVVPPLDVVMVWHTYLLNPKRYYEDSIRSETTFARRLAAMQSMPITLIASLIDPVSLEPTLPSYYREAFFELTSGLQFMYSIHTRTEDVVELTCPRCDAPNARVPWIVSGVGTGFGEAGFTYTCERCEREFTRAMMGVRKFCEEVARRRAGEKVYFAGTLIDGKEGEIVAKMRSFHIVQRIVHMFKLSKVYEEDDIIFQATELAKNMQWSTHEIALHVHHALIPQKKFRHGDHFFPRVQEVFDAYSGAGHASLDLVTCILHQSVFLQALEDMGWLDPRRFHSGCAQAPIFRAIARYHAFMDLIVAKNAGFLIPTLDIDLVWHTHQLSNENYREDTLRLLGHIPGHDDLLQPAVFQEMFRATATGWMNRFAKGEY